MATGILYANCRQNLIRDSSTVVRKCGQTDRQGKAKRQVSLSDGLASERTV
jgi:hypothetical protein